MTTVRCLECDAPFTRSGWSTHFCGPCTVRRKQPSNTLNKRAGRHAAYSARDELIIRWARQGMPEEEIASHLGVTVHRKVRPVLRRAQEAAAANEGRADA